MQLINYYDLFGCYRTCGYVIKFQVGFNVVITLIASYNLYYDSTFYDFIISLILRRISILTTL